MFKNYPLHEYVDVTIINPDMFAWYFNAPLESVTGAYHQLSGNLTKEERESLMSFMRTAAFGAVTSLYYNTKLTTVQYKSISEVIESADAEVLMDIYESATVLAETSTTELTDDTRNVLEEALRYLYGKKAYKAAKQTSTEEANAILSDICDEALRLFTDRYVDTSKSYTFKDPVVHQKAMEIFGAGSNPACYITAVLLTPAIAAPWFEFRLGHRKDRLSKLIELNAPDPIIEQAKRLCREMQMLYLLAKVDGFTQSERLTLYKEYVDTEAEYTANNFDKKGDDWYELKPDASLDDSHVTNLVQRLEAKYAKQTEKKRQEMEFLKALLGEEA